MGIADKMLLQVRVEGALTAEPGESSFGFGTQMNMWQLQLALLGRCVGLDPDVDEVGSRSAGNTGFGVQAASGDELGLDLLGKDPEQREEVVVGDRLLFAGEDARDVAAGQAGEAAYVGLLELALLGEPGEGDAEVAHKAVESFELRVESADWRRIAGVTQPGAQGAEGDAVESIELIRLRLASARQGVESAGRRRKAALAQLSQSGEGDELGRLVAGLSGGTAFFVLLFPVYGKSCNAQSGNGRHGTNGGAGCRTRLSGELRGSNTGFLFFCRWHWTFVQLAPKKASTIFFNFYFRQPGRCERKGAKRSERGEGLKEFSERQGL